MSGTGSFVYNQGYSFGRIALEMMRTIANINLNRLAAKFAAKTSEEPRGPLETTAGGEPPPHDHNHTTNTMTEWRDSRTDYKR